MAGTKITARKGTSSSLAALGRLAPRRNQEEAAQEIVPEVLSEAVPEPPQELLP